MRWIPRCGFLPVAYEVRDDVRTPSCRRMCAHPCYSRIFDTIITIYTRAVNGVYSLFELLAFKQTAAWLIINHHLDNLPLSNAAMQQCAMRNAWMHGAWMHGDYCGQSVCLWVNASGVGSDLVLGMRGHPFQCRMKMREILHVPNVAMQRIITSNVA